MNFKFEITLSDPKKIQTIVYYDIITGDDIDEAMKAALSNAENRVPIYFPAKGMLNRFNKSQAIIKVWQVLQY